MITLLSVVTGAGAAAAAFARWSTGGFCRCGHVRFMHTFGGVVQMCNGPADRNETPCTCEEFKRHRRRNLQAFFGVWAMVSIFLTVVCVVGAVAYRLVREML